APAVTVGPARPVPLQLLTLTGSGFATGQPVHCDGRWGATTTKLAGGIVPDGKGGFAVAARAPAEASPGAVVQVECVQPASSSSGAGRFVTTGQYAVWPEPGSPGPVLAAAKAVNRFGQIAGDACDTDTSQTAPFPCTS